MKTSLAFLSLLATAALLSGCVGTPHRQVFDAGDQLQIRSFQTRSFETANREAVLRAIIATLQDLGFVIEKVDATLGSVSGTKLRGYELRLSATIRPRSATQLLVRANAQFKARPDFPAKPIDEPGPYQDFFAALAKSLFLEAQEV